MGSLAKGQRALDAEIFEDIGEILRVGDVEIPGIFVKRPREIAISDDGSFVGVELSFDCQVSDAVGSLERGDEVSVIARDEEGDEDLGTYRFVRRLPPQGDESGLVVLELAYQ